MNNGFFKDKKYSSFFQTVERDNVPAEYNLNCKACGLYSGCKTPQMQVHGQGERNIFIIAEAPGATEDTEGVPLIGEAGQLLRGKLRELGIDLDRDCWKTNSVICRPPANRKPSVKELKCCAVNWQRDIDQFKPRFIWLFGGSALDSYFMGKLKGEEKPIITSWHHQAIPDHSTGAWVFPMFHPSYLLQKNGDPNLDAIFNIDLKWAISCLDRERPKQKNLSSKALPLTDFNSVITLLDNIRSNNTPIVFDYETSGLKPYVKGHKIYSIGIAEATNTVAYAFPYHYPHWKEEQFRKIQERWLDILRDPDIKKVAHNIKFEHKWSRRVLGVEVEGWKWDTMLAQHILDTRPKIKGLKAQAFLRYGITGYDVAIRRFMRSDERGFNELYKAPLKELLTYNAADAIIEQWLYTDQRRELNRRKGQQYMNDLYKDGAITFEDAEDEGMCIDSPLLKREKARLEKETIELTKGLLTSKEAIRFKKETGREISIASNKDLAELFYDIMKIQPPKVTQKGNPSLDEETLEQFDLPFVKKLLQVRKNNKITGTYIASFEREVVEGVIHPSLNLHIAASGRSSCTDPNLQNIPIRDEDAKRIREAIIARRGFKLMEADYKQIEVRIMACYTKDKVLIHYIENPDTDMHRDEGCNIFLCAPEQLHKEMRHMAKNMFVFPQFYGDWYAANAKAIWKAIPNYTLVDGTAISTHLSRQGIMRFDDFENHMQKVERRFWDRLHASKEWRDRVIADYQRKGYVETFFGFRRNGHLSRNQVCNTPIQGTAFHCLLWSYRGLNRLQKQEQWKSRMFMQIHDSVLTYVWPKEENYLKETFTKVMCKDIREEHPWIIVPLDVDFGITPVDGSWYNKS